MYKLWDVCDNLPDKSPERITEQKNNCQYSGGIRGELTVNYPAFHLGDIDLKCLPNNGVRHMLSHLREAQR